MEKLKNIISLNVGGTQTDRIQSRDAVATARCDDVGDVVFLDEIGEVLPTQVQSPQQHHPVTFPLPTPSPSPITPRGIAAKRDRGTDSMFGSLDVSRQRAADKRQDEFEALEVEHLDHRFSDVLQHFGFGEHYGSHVASVFCDDEACGSAGLFNLVG